MKQSHQDPRYDRHKLIDWFSQGELENSYIAVVGTGAVGNEVLKNLALLGVGKIDIFDFDKGCLQRIVGADKDIMGGVYPIKKLEEDRIRLLYKNFKIK